MKWPVPVLVLFDVDGTLLDSRATIVAAMTAAYTENGLSPPSPERIRQIVGLSLEVAVKLLSPELDGPTRAAVGDGYRDSYLRIHTDRSIAEPLFPGVTEAIDQLDAAGVLVGIATGKGRRALDAVLDSNGLTGRFATLQSGDFHPSKPDPAMVLDALAETGASAGCTIVVGDTSHDLLMARAAGTMAIGVTWGFHAADSLKVAGADAIVDDAADLAPAALRLLDRAVRSGQPA
jgi:phosphoglycolate phosphatase